MPQKGPTYSIYVRYVRQDDGIESSPIFPKVAQKVATGVFISKAMFFKNGTKVTLHFGNFCKNIIHQELSKIAQSGRTGYGYEPTYCHQLFSSRR